MELLADSVESVGYLLKDRVSDVNEFRASVRRVAEGGSAIAEPSSHNSSADTATTTRLPISRHASAKSWN